ncbi:MAG TPA: ATP-binding protein [Flavitalea sp.]|nr:ATP-binding protein [Flavitalea sp.]
MISTPVFPFLKGGGEMGELTRNLDWSKTPLGPPDQWPSSLRTATSIVLNSQFPMFVWWGEQLITIYNDSYKIIAGNKHPKLLGKSGREGWSEIWPDLAPLVSKVFQGESTWSEDLLLEVERRGYPEIAYFTFSYSPILLDSGAVGGLFCAVIETTEKIVNRKKIEESEYRFRSIVENAPVAIGLTRGREFLIESINDPMKRFLVRDGLDPVGRRLIDVLPELSRQPVMEILEQVIDSAESFIGSEVPIDLEIDGMLKTLYFNLAYTPMIEEGKVTGILHSALDVTEQVIARKKIEESEAELQQRVEDRTHELAVAIKELQRSNEQLEEFAHAASHDLKEPIRKIHFYTDRLRSQLSPKLGEDDNRMFERVENASHRMNLLIDDLLLYSHVSQRPHEKESIDLNDKMKRVIDDLELNIQEKNAIILVGHLPVVRGYRRQLQQLFHNLLTNALKYSRPDLQPEIRIDAGLAKGEDIGLPAGRKYHLVTVADNGIGFEQEHAEKIFQMFYRLHGKAEYQGTGVGLSIVRKVAENHEGRIVAESEPLKGATFKLYLPVE